MKHETVEINANELKLTVHFWVPDIPPYAIIQLSHGMMEHIARYDGFARFCCDHNIAVVGHDHRGHGQTATYTGLGNFGVNATWETLVDDIFLVSNSVREKYPNFPHFLLGHSFGSYLAQHAVLKHPAFYTGLILSGSSYEPAAGPWFGRLLASLFGSIVGKDRLGTLFRGIIFGPFNKGFKPARTRFDWLSSVPEEVDKYINDPFCGHGWTIGSYRELFDCLLKLYGKKQFLALPRELPLYLFAGEKDPNSKNVKTLFKLVHHLQQNHFKSVILKAYKDGRHEMFNEKNKLDVYKDVVDWVNDHI